jgi:hypothetical protein
MIRTTLSLILAAVGAAPAGDLWELAKSKGDVHVFSTLFTAQNVRDLLSSEDGLNAAIDWCKATGVTRVFVESFRDGYQADRAALEKASRRFREAGIRVSGCVTTTGVGKRTTGWKPLSCYTDGPTQEKVKKIFEYTAGLFDEIMIDDFWFTDCQCPECDAARRARTVTIGGRTYPVNGETWEDYRCELMTNLSREYVLGAAWRVNRNVKLIIKYPQWYDRFHERGYEVVRETADFHRIWVGTETRDRDKGGTMPYEAYFIMRWLGALGGQKTGGGWFDPYDTTERTYLEQARQTVLAGARESVLFCYGSLQEKTGPANVAALRREIPKLFLAAEYVGKRRPVGIAAYKPPNSHGENELYIFDYAGMLGLPLVPCHDFPEKASSAFFSMHALKDPRLPERLAKFIGAGKPVLLTDGLAARLEGKLRLNAPNVQVLPVRGDPKTLLNLAEAELNRLRSPLLKPLKTAFRAPNQVGLYLFRRRWWVIENFNDEPVAVELNGKKYQVPARDWIYEATVTLNGSAQKRR